MKLFLQIIEIGGCKLHGFPEIRNGRVSPVRPYRGSVLRVKCNPGFKIFGQPIIHCTGDEWSHKPVCASKLKQYLVQTSKGL